MTEARKIGPLTIRPEVIKGKKTNRWFLEIPATLSSTGKRQRPRYPSRTAAENVARTLKQKLELGKLGFAEAARPKGLSFKDAVGRWEDALELDVQSGELPCVPMIVATHSHCGVE